MSNRPIFDKVLIANRGEIACRVMKTCRRLGIKTVAVYSTADEQAKHVRMADEAVCVGPPASRESYLRIDAILDACVKTGANAVHPGYGFLSENAEFSAALAKNNIVFIGPDAPSIEAMGDKIHSKKLAKEAKVNTIPGHIGYVENHKQLLEVAHEIGYPVMVKASEGGGGKGMRVAYNDTECVEYFDMCREEAISAFNSDKMHVEKFIENPRHIEIQVIADRKGNTLYFPERECSIQRRNQKVIEEAPSTLITPDVRKAMGEQAAAMARRVDYVTAGTVEMVANPNRDFYFLEMNTRLQVEHPITELITGVDLVEQMLLAAAGRELSIKQEDIKINGHATEVRVYAEDPVKNFFPSVGRLSVYEEPEGDGVRCDSGIVEGSQISVYYDPLISKLCTWGPTRDVCLDRMNSALDKYVIRGLRHNVCLLRDVINQPRYRRGDITTNYLPEEYKDGFKKAALTPEQEDRLQAVSTIVFHMRSLNDAKVESQFKKFYPKRSTYSYSCGYSESRETSQVIHLTEEPNGSYTVQFAKKELNFAIEWNVEDSLVRATTTASDGAHPLITEYFQFHSTDEITMHMQYAGSIFFIDCLTLPQADGIKYMKPPKFGVSENEVHSPMPGVIVAIAAKPGDEVVRGAELLTLEAMKMRNKIRSEADGVIKSIKVKLGETVGDGDVLIELEPLAKKNAV